MRGKKSSLLFLISIPIIITVILIPCHGENQFLSKAFTEPVTIQPSSQDIQNITISNRTFSIQAMQNWTELGTIGVRFPGSICYIEINSFPNSSGTFHFVSETLEGKTTVFIPWINITLQPGDSQQRNVTYVGPSSHDAPNGLRTYGRVIGSGNESVNGLILMKVVYNAPPPAGYIPGFTWNTLLIPAILSLSIVIIQKKRSE